MTPTAVLIGGATGATGSAATKLLLEKGFPVRAFVHKDDERAHKLQALGAEIFVGELLDFRAVRRAFAGTKRAYFVYPMRPGLVQATAHYAQAALEAKAEFIVNMSQRTARPDALSDSALQHWLAERVFDWAGTPVTHLRPTAFNEWLLRRLQALARCSCWEAAISLHDLHHIASAGLVAKMRLTRSKAVSVAGSAETTGTESRSRSSGSCSMTTRWLAE